MNRPGAGKALAELAVIVLGVLIALLAESTWQDYRDRAEGRKYVARLAEEARANLAVLEGDRSWAAYACSSARSALSQLQGSEGDFDPAELLHSVVLASLYRNPEYQRVTHDDLVGTGGLSLIDDALLRSRIISAYTNFFGRLDAWRPPKDGPLRTAVLRTLPGEFINRVSIECIESEDAEERITRLRACDTAPEGVTSQALFEQLNATGTLAGDLRERAWQTCEFEEDMKPVTEQLEQLVQRLDSAS